MINDNKTTMVFTHQMVLTFFKKKKKKKNFNDLMTNNLTMKFITMVFFSTSHMGVHPLFYKLQNIYIFSTLYTLFPMK